MGRHWKAKPRLGQVAGRCRLLTGKRRLHSSSRWPLQTASRLRSCVPCDSHMTTKHH